MLEWRFVVSLSCDPRQLTPLLLTRPRIPTSGIKALIRLGGGARVNHVLDLIIGGEIHTCWRDCWVRRVS